MAAGYAVVASDIAGYRRRAHPRPGGMVVKPEDSLALADALTRVSSISGLRLEMGQHGRATAARYTLGSSSWLCPGLL